MPTCPNCKHSWKTTKVKTAVQYSNWLVKFVDGMFLVVGGYAATDTMIISKARHRRALALSGGRFLDRAQMVNVPEVESCQPLDFDTVPFWRLKAMENRALWGACLDQAYVVMP